MKFSHTQYAQALYESIQDTNPKEYDVVIENFIKLLNKNGDLQHYSKIIAVYEDYDRAQRGVSVVEVATAQETKLSKPLLDVLNDAVGKNTEIRQKIDSNLVGGVVVKVDDTLIDGSIRKQLEILEQSLKE